MKNPSWSVLCALGVTALSAPVGFGAAPPLQGPPMLPGSADPHAGFVQTTSAAVPRAIAPSAALAFDPSLTHLLAGASAKSTSRYVEPAGWPEVFNAGAKPVTTSPPAGSGSASGGGAVVTPVSPPAPTALTPAALTPAAPTPAAPTPVPMSGGGSAWTGGSTWVPSVPATPDTSPSSAPVNSGGSASVFVPNTPAAPVFDPTSAVSGGGASSGWASVVPSGPVALPVTSPPVDSFSTVPKSAVVAASPVNGDVPVADGGTSVLLLGIAFFLLAALRQRLAKF